MLEVQSLALRNYPYLAQESVPDIKKIVATSVKEKVASRLGESGCEMLSTFIEVNEIKEEMIIGMNNGSGESYRGTLAEWTIFLGKYSMHLQRPSRLLQRQLSSFNRHCQQGKWALPMLVALKFTWREGNDSLPSYFWGCCCYRVTARFQHDRGIP